MNIVFHPVRCPQCDRVVGEIATGLSRYKCRPCKRRIEAVSDGREMLITFVDTPLKVLATVVT